MQKYQKSGLQELVVPVPLRLVPVPNRFWRVVLVPLWMVPIPFCLCISGTDTTPVWYRYHPCLVPVPPLFGTSTKLQFCPEMAEFSLFHSPFFHNSLLLHPSSKTNMESLQTTPQTLNCSQRIQGFIPKFTQLYKTMEL